jgi:hypothetical protein
VFDDRAYRIDELGKVSEMITTLESVDFSGPYDDRRPLEAMKSWIETRRIELEGTDGGT